METPVRLPFIALEFVVGDIFGIRYVLMVLLTSEIPKKLEASDSLHKTVGIHPFGRTLFHCSFLALQFRLSKLVTTSNIESRVQKSINNLGSQGSPLNNELTMDGTQVSFTRVYLQ